MGSWGYATLMRWAEWSFSLTSVALWASAARPRLLCRPHIGVRCGGQTCLKDSKKDP